MTNAKLFWSGRSQAVRLPKAFRFEGEEVRIRRRGASVILEPVAQDWGWLDGVTGPVDADFAAAAVERQDAQERPPLRSLRSFQTVSLIRQTARQASPPGPAPS